MIVTFTSKLLSLELPGYLGADVLEDTLEGLQVSFKHKTRATGGPNVFISLRAPKDKAATLTSVITQKKEAMTALMTGSTQSVDINKLGEINGAGFALVGTPAKAKGGSGVEFLETTFLAPVSERLLEVRLSAEQQYSSEARVVWSSIARSITLVK